MPPAPSIWPAFPAAHLRRCLRIGTRLDLTIARRNPVVAPSTFPEAAKMYSGYLLDPKAAPALLDVHP